MKKFNVSDIFGPCIICAGIIIAGAMIAGAMPDTPQIPGSLTISNSGKENQFGDYLSEGEAAAYLRIDEEEMNKLVRSGEIDFTCAQIGGTYVFSKEMLKIWADSQISD